MEWLIVIVGALIVFRIWVAQLWLGKQSKTSFEEVLSRIPPPPKPPKPLRSVDSGNDRYPLTKDQTAQIDCRNSFCRFHEKGACTNISPALTIVGKTVTCWTEVVTPDLT